MADEKDLNQPDGAQVPDDNEALASEADAGDEAMSHDPGAMANPASFKVTNASDASEDDAEAAMLAMLEDLPQEASKADVNDINFSQASVSKAEFQHLSQPAGGNDPRNIELLMDVDLPIAIELGRTKMSISDILSLGPGSVVELNKLAGEPVDLLVNQKVVARGEVVVIDENFGVRITQLLTPEERLRTLGAEY